MTVRISLEGSKEEGAGCLQQRGCVQAGRLLRQQARQGSAARGGVLQQPSLTKDIVPVAEAAQAAGPERGRRQVLRVSQGAGRASAASARDDAQHRWKSGTALCMCKMQRIMRAAGADIAAVAAA